MFYTTAIEKIIGYEPKKFLDDSKLWKKIIYPDDVNGIISI